MHESDYFFGMFGRAALILLIGIALGACAGRRSAAKKRPGALISLNVGNICLVNEESGFVLIDAVQTPASGTQLQAFSGAEQETALLKVSPERKPPFIIADIVRGTPHAGDRAVLAEDQPKK